MRKRSWSLKHERNIHTRDNKRFSVTIFGAISNSLQGKLCYMLGTSTNASEYQAFLRLCKSKMVFGCEKAVMLYDGHRAHTTERSVGLCQRYFYPLKSVAHSSDFNSIETFWSLVKNNLQKLLLLHSHELTKAGFEALVRRSMQMVAPSVISNIIRANQRYLNEVLAQV